MSGLVNKKYWWNHFATLSRKKEGKTILTRPDKNQEIQSRTQDDIMSLADLSQTARETTPTSDNIVRAETNLLNFPFFALWDKDVRNKTKNEYRAEIKRGHQKLEIVWKVLAQPEYGYPSPFDKKVYKAIEQIINEIPRPVQNPIPLGSFYSLCKELGLKAGGAQYERIKQSLRRIIATTIDSKGAFYVKERGKWIEETFHLYERLVSKGEEQDNGEIAETNLLFLNSWYLGNINANYVKPIDWGYYKSLKTPLAQRLYELLGVKFYGVISRRGKELSYRYSTLCELLPTARQKYLSKAKTILNPAHEKLKRTGFLADYKWSETSPKTKGDWLITYFIGKRARDEFRQAKTYFKSPQLEFDALPEPEPEEQPEPLNKEQGELFEKLVELNVSKIAADDLVRYFDNDSIGKWIEAIDYADPQDKPAYLVKAIRESWAFPEKWLKAKENEEREAETAEEKRIEEQKKEEEQRKKREKSQRLNEIYDSLSDEQKEEVDKESENRLPGFARERLLTGQTDSPILQASLKTNREQIINEWLKSGKIKSTDE